VWRSQKGCSEKNGGGGGRGHRMYCYEGCQAVPARPSCKSVRRQGKVLGSKEGRVVGNGMFAYGVEEKNSSV
jgi:hypothetical protein